MRKLICLEEKGILLWISFYFTGYCISENQDLSWTFQRTTQRTYFILKGPKLLCLDFKSVLVYRCGLQVEWAMQRTCLDSVSPCIFGDCWTLLQLCCQEVPGPSLKGKKTTCQTSCISVWRGAGCGTSFLFWRNTQELTLSTLGR